MANNRFFYVTFIRAPQEKVWRALFEPEFTRLWWNETVQESDWKVGSEWKIRIPDGRIADTGEVLEFDPPRRLKVSWRNEFIPGMAEEGYSRCAIELETHGDVVRLALTHEIDLEDSKLIAGVSQGWPALMASLKSFLETGEPLEMTRKWPGGR